MLNQIFSFLLLLSLGVILVFACGTLLHFKLKKQNQKSRDAAMKVQSDEPSD